MSDFVSWCRHLLVSFLFHEVTSLHPPSFHRNDFSTCSTHFSFFLFGHLRVCAVRNYLCTRMRTRTTPPFTHVYCTRMLWRLSVSAPPRSTVGIYGERKTIAWCPCTPPSTVETFGKTISAEACSGKEIAGLLRKTRKL